MAKRFEFSDLVAGASISQLGQMFDLDRRTVTERLKNMAPAGRRAGHPIYKISEVAPLMVSGYMGADEVDEKQRRLKAGDEKDYWDAKLKEQKYLENRSDLWRTEKVIDVFASVFKQFRETVVVFVDNLEHESGLPPEAIDKTKQFADGLLIEMRDRLTNLNVDPSDDH